MEYTPAEIEDETGISAVSITRNFVTQGLPIRRDNRKRIWITGTVFAEWMRENKMRTKKLNTANKRHLKQDEFLCVSCRQITTPKNIIIDPVKNHAHVDCAHSVCENCGRKVHKFVKKQVVKND